MSEYRDIFKQIGRRLVVALPLFLLGAGGSLVGEKAEESPLVVGLGAGLLSMACILAGSIIMARPVARLFSEPLGSIFFPNEHYDRPQPIYSIPEARRKEGKYEEAVDGFAKIVADDPQEVRAHASMIDVAIINLKDVPRAEALFTEALTTLQRREDRERLINCFNNSMSMLRNERDGIPDRPPIATDAMKRRPRPFWK